MPIAIISHMTELPPRVINLISKQVLRLQAQPPEGVVPLIDEDDPTNVQADIKGPDSTPYHGGTFRCRLEFASDFPQTPPKGYFLTKLFHPNISAAGEICVNTLKRDWNPANWSFINIMQVVRCLLVEPFPESALNEEAGRLFMEDYRAYFEHARLLTQVHAMARQMEMRVEEEKKPKTKLDQLKKWMRRT